MLNKLYIIHWPKTVWTDGPDSGANVPKRKKLQHLLHTIPAYMCQEEICPPYFIYIYATYAKWLKGMY